jgi:hypothetical protein
MSAVLGTPYHGPLLRRMTRLGDRGLWQSGPIGAPRKARYDRRFEAAHGNVKMFRGIYDDYDAAAASAPGTHPVGWDNVLSSKRLEHERLRIFSSDYPTLFWLSRLLAGNGFVFDLHGNVGTAYVAFRRLLPFPADLTWQFVAAFEDEGYRRVDSWLNYELNCFIPFYPEYTIPTYSGYYFVRETS